MKNVGTFYAHFEYITAIWYTLWSFGNFVAILVYFPCFGILSKEKSGNPATKTRVQKSHGMKSVKKSFFFNLASVLRGTSLPIRPGDTTSSSLINIFFEHENIYFYL
jgi:hypothetical protein